MPREIEAKLKVESHEPVRKHLRAVGALRLLEVIETNSIFDRPDGSLRRGGCGLRIRSSKDVDTGHVSATLTFKGPTHDRTRRDPDAASTFKSREELETTIGDAATGESLLAGLGFVRVLRFEKRRESWKLGDCLVELDRPPHLGLFVEIEGHHEKAIRKVQLLLDLGDRSHVGASYVRMLLSYCQDHGIVDRIVNLPAEKHPSA